MNEKQFQNALQTLLEEVAGMDDQDRTDLGIDRELAICGQVDTFADRGVLTNNAGLVIQLPDGSEFQLTIVQSKRPADGGQVAEDDACPNCGEYDTDELVWDDDGEKVTCQSCGTTYRPGEDDDSDCSPAGPM